MAGVTVDSGKPSEYGSYYDYPPERWPELAEVRKNYIDRKLTFDCRCLVKWIKEAEEMAPVLGYASGREMVEEYYQLDPEEIAIAIRWLELNDPEEAIGIEEVQALAKHGTNQHSAGPDNIRSTSYGTDRTYTLRRLARDRPDLLSRVQAGELSANAAAIEAGFRKRTVTVDPVDVDALIRMIRKYLTTEQRQALIKKL